MSGDPGDDDGVIGGGSGDHGASVVLSCIDYFNGASQTDLASKHGMSRYNIANICNTVYYVCQSRSRSGEPSGVDLDEMGKLFKVLHLSDMSTDDYMAKIKPMVDEVCLSIRETASSVGASLDLTPTEFLKLVKSRRGKSLEGGGGGGGGGSSGESAPQGGRRPTLVDLIRCGTSRGKACQAFGEQLAEDINYYSVLERLVGRALLFHWPNLADKGGLWSELGDINSIDGFLSQSPEKLAELIVGTIVSTVNRSLELEKKYGSIMEEIAKLQDENRRLSVYNTAYASVLEELSARFRNTVQAYDSLLHELLTILNQDQMNQLIMLLHAKNLIAKPLQGMEVDVEGGEGEGEEDIQLQ